jgi:hypothetical protein
MALEFGFIESKDNQLNVVGPQFEQDATSTKIVSFESTSTGIETAYTVTTGKTFFLTKVLLANTSVGVDYNVALYINDNLIHVELQARNSTKQIDFATPVPVLSGQIIEVRTNHSGSVSNFIGIEQ